MNSTLKLLSFPSLLVLVLFCVRSSSAATITNGLWTAPSMLPAQNDGPLSAKSSSAAGNGGTVIADLISGLKPSQEHGGNYYTAESLGFGNLQIAATAEVLQDGGQEDLTNNAWSQYDRVFAAAAPVELLSFWADFPLGATNYDAGNDDFNIGAVPEPGSILLFGLGLLVLAPFMKRARRQQHCTVK